MVFAREESEIGYFFCEEGCFLHRVGWFDADEDEKTSFDFGDDFVVDGDLCSVHALDENFHNDVVRCVEIVCMGIVPQFISFSYICYLLSK